MASLSYGTRAAKTGNVLFIAKNSYILTDQLEFLTVSAFDSVSTKSITMPSFEETVI